MSSAVGEFDAKAARPGPSLKPNSQRQVLNGQPLRLEQGNVIGLATPGYTPDQNVA